MRNLLRAAAVLLFVSAVVALSFLLFADLKERFQPTAAHRQAAAFVLLSIGSAAICFQLGSAGRWRGRLEGILLGSAFALWGAKQFLQPSSAVTIIESIAITLFIVGLGLNIRRSLSRQA